MSRRDIASALATAAIVGAVILFVVIYVARHFHCVP